MIPLPCRTKGGAPQLGAKGPHQRGPFGRWPDPDDLDEDDDQDDEQHVTTIRREWRRTEHRYGYA